MNLVNGYGQPIHLDGVNGIFDTTEVVTSNQFWFTGKDSSTFGTIGQVMACKAGERFFWNGSLATNGGHTKPKLLPHLPDTASIYDTSITIGAEVTENEDGSYTATADGAIFFPAVFQSGSTVESYIANNYAYLGGGNWFIFKGVKIDPYYVKNFPVNHVFNTSPSPLDLAGMLKNYIPMVGAKVAVLGDSLSEQSAGYAVGAADSYGFRAGTYDSYGWFSRIARKYGMDYRVHGYGMQWWYCTDARPNGGVKAVNSLIESGYVPDYIIMEYGTNDIWTGTLGGANDTANAGATSTVGALRYCIETLQSAFPAAKILVVMPCMRNGEDNNAYYELVVPILHEYGVAHVDMAYESGIVLSMMNSDGVHLAIPITGGYDNTTEAVVRYSRCLESVMLRL